MSPVEPPPSSWNFSTDPVPDEHGIVGVGGDLRPGTVLAAYRHGLFPMHLSGRMLAWWSPDPRGVLPLDGVRVTRSLRRSARDYEIRVDTAFAQVIDACADKRRSGAWINRKIRSAYLALHELGWVHSVEAWTADGRLAGGLYGVAIGGFFAGESMFHRERDASKVALLGLVELLRGGGATLLDVQWRTDHLATLGAVEVPRPDYLARLDAALDQPLPERWR